MDASISPQMIAAVDHHTNCSGERTLILLLPIMAALVESGRLPQTILTCQLHVPSTSVLDAKALDVPSEITLNCINPSSPPVALHPDDTSEYPTGRTHLKQQEGVLSEILCS